MEIYSPDLAAAQRELLFIYQSDKNSDLFQRAKQRLRLLGMQENQITNILNSGKILYRIPVYSNASGYILEKSLPQNALPNSAGSGPTPSSSAGEEMGMGMGAKTVSGSSGPVSSSSPVLLREGQYVQAGQTLFTIYNQHNLVAEFGLNAALASRIKKGQKLIFHRAVDKSTLYTGTVGLINPTLNSGSSFTTARVYLKDKDLEPGQLVTAEIPILSRGWWVPQKTVLSLGNTSVVFKKREEVFIPVKIKTLMTAEGWVLVEDDIGDWDIASNAAFMVDSESFIKAISANEIKH